MCMCVSMSMVHVLGHNLLMQFSSLASSKMESSETDFCDIPTIQNHQISYGKHVLEPLCVFFTLFRVFFCGGPKGAGVHTTCLCSFPLQLKNGNFRN